MNDYKLLFEQIPIEYNLFALIVFSSILLGCLVVLVIFLKNSIHNRAISFLGYGVLMFVFTLTDFFLSYTGLMKYVPWLNNSAETIVLFIPILVYFFIVSFLKQEKVSLKQVGWHVVIPLFYFIVQLGIHVQPNALKLNNYISGFHPDLMPIPIEMPSSIWYQVAFYITEGFHGLLIALFVGYSIAVLRVIKTYNIRMKKQFPSSSAPKKLQKYKFSIYVIGYLLLATIVCIVIFTSFKSDLGEQYIMLCPMFAIFIVAYLMMSSSRFFDKSWLIEKYNTTRLNISSSDILKKIKTFVQDEQYYLKKNSSLADLATQLSLSPTYLSQIINSELGKNFNDFINHYRIEEAKKRLIDEAYSHFNMAGIGDMVGFNSKSSFYAVFKKYTQLTPAAYAKAMKTAQENKP
ncbi:MAG: helix-turn-helix domain-containing protein [Chitinophagales bacterium]